MPNPARAINETEPASIIVPTETIKNVKVMYEMIIQGNTMNKVAQYLNSIGEKVRFHRKILLQVQSTESSKIQYIKEKEYSPI